MTDTDELPRWTPRDGLDVTDLANTLEHIRRMAWMHYMGDAFDPEHMHAIAAAAGQALCGEPIHAPTDLNSPEWRALATERHQRWLDLCDDEVVALARYVDSGDADLDEDEAAQCERCAGDVCGTCGECPGFTCRECACDRRDRDGDEPGGDDG